MVSIREELIEALKTHKFTIPVKDVRDVYSTKNPVYPMITVDEVVNIPWIQIHAVERLSTISYKFDVYARDMSYQKTVYTKRKITEIIGNELDEFLRTTYGLKRAINPTSLPYSEDGSIIRYTVTYSGTIDNETMIIYQ